MTTHRRPGPLIVTESVLALLGVASLVGVVDALVLMKTDHGLSSNETNDGWGGLIGTVGLLIWLSVLVVVGLAMVELWVSPTAGYRTAKAVALWLIVVVVLWFVVALAQRAVLEVLVPMLVSLSALIALFAAARTGARHEYRADDA